jgi:hypothetical protein
MQYIPIYLLKPIKTMIKLIIYLFITILLLSCKWELKGNKQIIKWDGITLKQIIHDSMNEISSNFTHYELKFMKGATIPYHMVKIFGIDSVMFAPDGLKYLNYYGKGFSTENIQYYENKKWHKGNGAIEFSSYNGQVHELHEFDSVRYFIHFGFTKPRMQTSIDSIKCKLQLFDNNGRDTTFIFKFSTDKIQW